jgi:protein TonB
MHKDPAVMTTRTQALLWAGVSVASVFVHVAAFGGLPSARSDGFGGKRKRPSVVEVEVAKPKPPAPPPPEPAKAEPKAPRLAVARAARVNAVKAAAPPPPAALSPPAEAPADFTGTTLTNDGPGEGWASATGSGEAMQGPVGKPGAKITGSSAQGAPPPDRGPPVVGVADLSRPPAPPDLAEALERLYPPEARQKGTGGKAVVRARIMPDGSVRELSLLSESGAGFGEACKQSLRASRWTPPLDRDGQAVSTFVSYTCRFEVR